jgi:ABC-2 type transport system permease protein
MNLRRVGILLLKELVWGPKNYIFIMAVAAPLLLSLLINLLVGTFFSGRPRLGVADAGQSRLVVAFREMPGLLLREYDSAEEVRTAVQSGAVDVGMVLPATFDEQIRGETPAPLTVYIYGESLLRHRAFLGTAIAAELRALAGQQSRVTIVTESVGEGESVPWEERLLPFVVLMSIILGGSMVPATSLVEEKQKRTITAVTVTPTTLEEVFLAKGLVGVALSITMGVMILAINGVFGAQPLLLLVLLAMGAVMAAVFGVLLGAFVKDINTLFATIKAVGILLYAPAIVYLFPDLPQWVARIFPTYYMIAPVVAVSQQGAGWADVQADVAVLALLIAALIILAAFIARRARTQPGLLPGVVA